MKTMVYAWLALAFFGLSVQAAPVSITVVGESHEGDTKSDRRRAELIRRYAKGNGDILLAMENEFNPLEKRAWVEKVWGKLAEPQVIGVDGDLPHAAAVYSVFRYFHNRRFLLMVVRDAPDDAKVKAKVDHFHYLVDMMGEEALLAILHEAVQKPELLKIPAAFEKANITQKEIGDAFKSLIESIENKDFIARKESAKTDEERLNVFSEEQLKIWFSDKGLVLTAALVNFMDSRLVSALEKGKTNSNLQTPQSIIDHFKNYPELLRDKDPRKLLKAPYNSPLNDTVLVTWRNDVMVRNMVPVVVQAEKSGKPVYFIVGKKHVEHMVTALKKAFPKAAIAQE